MTIPLRAYRDVPVEPLAGKVVIDTNNYYPSRDGQIAELDAKTATSSGLLQRHLPTSRVVKAFNTISSRRIVADASPPGTAERNALAIASDDPDALDTVAAFIDQLGFDTVRHPVAGRELAHRARHARLRRYAHGGRAARGASPPHSADPYWTRWPSRSSSSRSGRARATRAPCGSWTARRRSAATCRRAAPAWSRCPRRPATTGAAASRGSARSLWCASGALEAIDGVDGPIITIGGDCGADLVRARRGVSGAGRRGGLLRRAPRHPLPGVQRVEGLPRHGRAHSARRRPGRARARASALDPKRLVFAGIRAPDPGEQDYLRDAGIATLSRAHAGVRWSTRSRRPAPRLGLPAHRSRRARPGRDRRASASPSRSG